ncbi:MAG: histidine triad nucleotide-binding protein [Campylobacter sp.]|nr:histidine triad nucleotide-binding protein [Campylobacter sp.]
MKNVFQQIIDGELPCNKVLENNKFLAFHDVNPQAPIHILTVPKKCYENFQVVDPNIMSEMTEFIQSVAVKMGVDKSGYRLINNCGQGGGQEIMHLHFHLLAGAKLTWGSGGGHNAKDEF